MKKKSIAIILAAVLSLAMASCSSKQSDSSAAPESSAVTDNAANAPVDKDGNLIGTKQEGAVKEVNMGKIDGQKLQKTQSSDADLSAKGKLSGIKVSIDEAKLIDTENGKAVVVSFTFKNATANPLSFDGLFTVSAVEGGVSFAPMAVTGIEGINVNSAVEAIDSGSSATVQKTYAYNGEKTMEVTVGIYGEPAGERIGATFVIEE